VSQSDKKEGQKEREIKKNKKKTDSPEIAEGAKRSFDGLILKSFPQPFT
jgi:hypothetical protein